MSKKHFVPDLVHDPGSLWQRVGSLAHGAHDIGCVHVLYRSFRLRITCLYESVYSPIVGTLLVRGMLELHQPWLFANRLY